MKTVLGVRDAIFSFALRDGLRVIGLQHLLYLSCTAIPGFFEPSSDNSWALYTTAAAVVVSVRMALSPHERAGFDAGIARRKALATIRHRFGDDETFKDLFRTAPADLRLNADEANEVLSDARYLADRVGRPG